jgi:hypothetical protein
VAVYSLRARERPTVSAPVSWEEVERALKKKDANLLVFEARQTLARVGKMGDLFAPVNELKQSLPNLKGLAASAVEKTEEPISIAAPAEERPKRARSHAAPNAVKPPLRKSRRKV